jgi:clan AA aspartic protease
MGLTYTSATVEALDRSGNPIEARFLVDTGAVDCLMPTSALRKAGILPEGTDTYELANGQAIELPFGWARIQFMETLAIAKVIFGPEDAEPILGVIALESAGMVVDPLTNTLKRLAVRSLKKVA